jgi:hypothetical protein
MHEPCKHADTDQKKLQTQKKNKTKTKPKWWARQQATAREIACMKQYTMHALTSAMQYQPKKLKRDGHENLYMNQAENQTTGG